MKPLRTRLQEARKRLGLPWEVLERDYLLSWVLAGIAQVESLRDTLIFKGGTALKKCYFGDYRFSEDLDFSGLEGAPTGDAMERAVREACGTAVKLLDEYAPVEISCERYTEKEPHPGGQEAFTIRDRRTPAADYSSRLHCGVSRGLTNKRSNPLPRMHFYKRRWLNVGTDRRPSRFYSSWILSACSGLNLRFPCLPTGRRLPARADRSR